MRLIDAYALKERIRKSLGIKSLTYLTMQEKAIVDQIDYAQTVDAVPAVHGRWVFNDKKGLFDCADCGISSHYQYNFCPHCGAKMEGDAE